MILKSLAQLKKTPEQVADEAAKTIMDHVINGMLRSPRGIYDEAHRYGRGEAYIHKSRHFSMALLLMS